MGLNLGGIGTTLSPQVDAEETNVNSKLDNLDVTDAKSMMEMNMEMTRWNLMLQFEASMIKDLKEGVQACLRNM